MPFPCFDCGLMLQDGATFCPRCRPRVLCHRCGAPVYEKALICSYCHGWLRNRRRGPFWWQAYGTHLSVAAVVYLGPLGAMLFLVGLSYALDLWSRFNRLQQRVDKPSLLLLTLVTAISIALVYATEKHARRRRPE